MALQIPLTQASDEDLVTLYQQHQSERIFTLLYERYYSKIYNKCSFLLKYHQLDPEDAAQEILIKVHKNLMKYNHSAKFSTWVFSITRHYCIDRLRQKSRRPIKVSIEEEGCKQLSDDFEDPFSREVDRIEQLFAQLDVVLEQDMREAETQILRMKYHDGLTTRDISHKINKTESAVKMRIKRAKRKAASKYADRFQE